MDLAQRQLRKLSYRKSKRSAIHCAKPIMNEVGCKTGIFFTARAWVREALLWTQNPLIYQFRQILTPVIGRAPP